MAILVCHIFIENYRKTCIKKEFITMTMNAFVFVPSRWCIGEMERVCGDGQLDASRLVVHRPKLVPFHHTPTRWYKHKAFIA